MGRFLNIVVCHLKSTRVPKYSGRSGKYVACCPVVILEQHYGHNVWSQSSS